MRPYATPAAIALLLFATGTPAAAQQQPAAGASIDVQALGPQVGSKLPSFSLPDQTGQVRTPESLMGREGLILVFSRSADWCPYCKTQLVEMEGRLEDVRQNGYEMAIITYDPVPVLADFAARRGITYPLLSDEGSKVIREYGILNTTVNPESPLFGYPFPGTFIVNREGVITSRFFEETYQERNTVSSVLVRLGHDVDVPATKVSAPHLEITSYATDGVAAAGTHFSVVLDITPEPDIHVYAPGVTGGYRPIALTLEPPPGVVLLDAQYPAPEEYLFEPLNERVIVYQRPFRIVQDLMIDASREAQAALQGVSSFTIRGTLDYQACDDKICYNPQRVPLTWTVGLIPLDRERAAR